MGINLWEKKKWGALASLAYGKALRKDQYSGSSFPVYGTNGQIGWHGQPLCQTSGVIIGRKGAYRGVHYSEKPFFVIDTAFYLVPKNNNEFDIKWAYYQLLDFDINKIDSGSAIPSTSREAFYEIPVRLPPLDVQKKISSILSTYDDLIENNTRRIRILEEMAQSLYREWFVHFRFPGHEKVKMVDSPLGKAPEGWALFTLETVCDRITDGAHDSPASVENGYPMASVKDMHDWGFNIDGCRQIGEEDYERLVRNDCRPKKNDVLIAKDGSYLKHTFVVCEEQDLAILSSIAILRPNELIRPNYLNFILRDPKIKGRMKGVVSGVALPRIILKDFRKFKVLVAPLSIQNEWSQTVDQLVDLCRSLLLANENLHRTRDLLLPKLISGNIEVENLSGLAVATKKGVQ